MPDPVVIDVTDLFPDEKKATLTMYDDGSVTLFVDDGMNSRRLRLIIDRVYSSLLEPARRAQQNFYERRKRQP